MNLFLNNPGPNLSEAFHGHLLFPETSLLPNELSY